MVQYRVAFRSFKRVTDSLDFFCLSLFIYLWQQLLKDTKLNRSKTSQHEIFKCVIKNGMSKDISLHDILKFLIKNMFTSEF